MVASDASRTFISDADAEDDALAFEPYVQGLVNLIADRTTEAPLTLGVLGSWGTGKTSLLRQIRRKLRDGPRQFDHRKTSDRTLWINVWELSLQGDLTRSFLQTLLTECRRRLPWHRRLQFDLYLLRRRLDGGAVLRQLAQNSYRLVIAAVPIIVAALQPSFIHVDTTTGWLATTALGLWLLVKPLLEVARDKVSLDLGTILEKQPYDLQVSVLRTLSEDFERLVHLWVGDDGRLVVFVDDLDRCSPQLIPGVLEAIKLFLTIKRCIYVLALDEDVIAGSIQSAYAGVDGKRYLEKIVQLPFMLPSIDANQIVDYVKTFNAAWPGGDDRCADIFAHGLPPNPRLIKRAVNVFLLLSGFVRHRQGIGDLVTPLRLAKVVALQTGYAAVFERLRDAPDLIKRLESASLEGSSGGPPALGGVAAPDDVRQQRFFFELFRVFKDEPSARFAELSTEELARFFSLAGRVASGAASDVSAQSSLTELVRRYHTIRSTQPSGGRRTRAMTDVVTEMVALAASLGDFDVRSALASAESGWRLAAYAFLYARPDSNWLKELVATLTQREDRPFGQYWALQAVAALIKQAHARGVTIDASIASDLRAMLEGVRSDTDPSRYNSLTNILESLETGVPNTPQA